MSHELCLSRRHAAGIRFQRPLDQFRQIELVAKSSEQKFQLRGRERGRRAAAEINCRWKKMSIFGLLAKLAQNCFAKSRRLRAIEEFFVKSAVRANPRAEWDVHVEMADSVGRTGRDVMQGITHRFA